MSGFIINNIPIIKVTPCQIAITPDSDNPIDKMINPIGIRINSFTTHMYPLLSSNVCKAGND